MRSLINLITLVIIFAPHVYAWPQQRCEIKWKLKNDTRYRIQISLHFQTKNDNLSEIDCLLNFMGVAKVKEITNEGGAKIDFFTEKIELNGKYLGKIVNFYYEKGKQINPESVESDQTNKIFDPILFLEKLRSFLDNPVKLTMNHYGIVTFDDLQDLNERKKNYLQIGSPLIDNQVTIGDQWKGPFMMKEVFTGSGLDLKGETVCKLTGQEDYNSIPCYTIQTGYNAEMKRKDFEISIQGSYISYFDNAAGFLRVSKGEASVDFKIEQTSTVLNITHEMRMNKLE